MSIPVWMIRAHDISHTIKGNSKKCPSFHSFPMLHTSLEYCVASIYVIPLLGYLCNGISTSIMNIMMNWRCCRHLYRWLKLMVHHTQSKAEAKSVPVFFHSCWTIHWVLCGQYGCDTLALELVQWCISPLMNREWCQHLNWCLDLIIHHTPSQAEYESAPVFIHPPMVHPLDIVWPVWIWPPCFSCLYNGELTSSMNTLMDWEGCQHLYEWLELVVHHTPPSNAEDESAPVSSIHPWYIIRILCGQFGYDPRALGACIMVKQTHKCIHWWIERGVNTYMDGGSSWYIIHHPRQ